MNRIFLFTALLTFNASAQDSLRAIPIADPGNAAHVSRWQIGISFSPDMAYRTLSGEPEWVIDLRDDSEKPLLGYTAGANFVFNAGDHSGIEAGVHFSEKGYRVKADLINSQGEIVGKSVNKDVYDYIEIPLKANYTLGQHRLRWTISAGIINGILVNARRIAKYDIEGDSDGKSTVDNTSDFESYNLSAQLSTGIDWQIGTGLHLKVEPIFRYGFTQITDAPITANLWSAGLQTGLYFNL